MKKPEMFFTLTTSELGMRKDGQKYTFTVWSPNAEAVFLNLYKEDILLKKHIMVCEDGFWSVALNEDLDGLFYTYTFDHGSYQKEAPDLYSKAVGLNGDRTAIIDLADTDPEGFDKDKGVRQKHLTEAIIWEVHVEDFSANTESKNRGKYLAFTEQPGLNYLKKLGVNYVHLLPVNDFVNDERDEDYYNWGYDPKNYMVPEGKYSSNPADPYARIRELKQLIMALHQNSIGVVLDVVLNHTYESEHSWFEYTVPGYYHRFDEEGEFSNGSGVGNETASERPMMRQYMIDVLNYWVEEYHVDGFRFDLMGVHDTETMNAIRESLDDDIILYGEPWAGGKLAMSEGYFPADMAHIHNISERIGVFNAKFRDQIKGDVFAAEHGGFLQGELKSNDEMIVAIKANTLIPTKIVNYSSAHDNYTLYDKLKLSTDYDDEKLITLNKINAAILMTSQGAVFMQAGEEFARSKDGNPNTYNVSMPLDWKLAEEHKDLVDYYSGMIAIRKAHDALRDPTTVSSEAMVFFDTPANVLAYQVDNVMVLANTSQEAYAIDIDGDWRVLADNNIADINGIGKISAGKLILEPLDLFILAQ